MTKNGLVLGTMLTTLVLLAPGCATTSGGGPGDLSDEEQITKMFADWKTAFELGDVEAFTTMYSDAYSNSDGMTKEGIAQTVTFLADEGYLEYINIGLGGAQAVVTGDSAQMTGIAFETPEGGEDVGFVLERQDDGTWKIVADVE